MGVSLRSMEETNYGRERKTASRPASDEEAETSGSDRENDRSAAPCDSGRLMRLCGQRSCGREKRQSHAGGQSHGSGGSTRHGKYSSRERIRKRRGDRDGSRGCDGGGQT